MDQLKQHAVLVWHQTGHAPQNDEKSAMSLKIKRSVSLRSFGRWRDEMASRLG